MVRMETTSTKTSVELDTPIAYTVKYLKDNRIAKMVYNTDYRLETYNTYAYDHESLDVDNDSICGVLFVVSSLCISKYRCIHAP